MQEIEEIKKEIISLAENHELYKNILKTKGNIVISRGSENPKFLFIGEAPGFTENKIGSPFVGRSGKILDRWIKDKITNYSIINTIPIIPLNEEGKIRPPSKKEIEYFKPATNRLIKAMNPEYIICIGKSASNFMNLDFKLSEWEGNIGFIYHPAYYLRNGKDGMEDFERLMKNISQYN